MYRKTVPDFKNILLFLQKIKPINGINRDLPSHK